MNSLILHEWKTNRHLVFAWQNRFVHGIAETLRSKKNPFGIIRLWRNIQQTYWRSYDAVMFSTQYHILKHP